MEVLSSRVIFHTTDLRAARSFYEGTLGLHLYREYGVDGEVLGVVYFLGGGFLEVSRSGEQSPPLILWLQVRDAAGEEARLSAAGIEVVKPVERMGWGLVETWVRAPDGNELRLIEVPDDHPLRGRT